jgi:hypothetical protein
MAITSPAERIAPKAVFLYASGAKRETRYGMNIEPSAVLRMFNPNQNMLIVM